MKKEDQNLLESLRIAQESMAKCDAFYGEANDDSCRNIYARIKDMLQEQRALLQKELDEHKEAGEQ